MKRVNEKDLLSKKAQYSLMINDGYYENDDVYRGYAIDKSDRKAFSSKEEVDLYLNQLLEEMSAER